MTRKCLCWRFQGLRRAILEAFLPKVNWLQVELYTQKGEYPKASIDHFIQTFQKQTALHPEPPEKRNLLIYALVGNFLPDIKQQIQNRVIGWSGNH